MYAEGIQTVETFTSASPDAILSLQWGEKETWDYINKHGKEYGLSTSQKHEVFETVRCETKGTFDHSIQSECYYKGVREDSWGLAQWNLPSKNRKKDGTLITKEDAMNPEISLDTMLWYFSQGLEDKWTCWRTLYQ